MSFNLPKGTDIEPADEAIFCHLYSPTAYYGGSIIIPEVAQQQVFIAQIIKVGPGRIADFDKEGHVLRKPISLKEGDDVLFFRWHGERLSIDNSEYIVMRAEDVLAKVTVPPEEKDKYLRFGQLGDAGVSLDNNRVVA